MHDKITHKAKDDLSRRFELNPKENREDRMNIADLSPTAIVVDGV